MGEHNGDFAFGESAQEALEIFRKLIVGRVGDESVQVVGDGADVFGDAPFVIIEDADKTFGGLGDVVQGLEGNTIGQGGIAKNRNDIFVCAALVARGSNAQSCRQSCAGMSSAVAIVLAFGAQGEAAQAIGAADGVKAVLATG